jgi:hypothetical protein
VACSKVNFTLYLNICVKLYDGPFSWKLAACCKQVRVYNNCVVVFVIYSNCVVVFVIYTRL